MRKLLPAAILVIVLSGCGTLAGTGLTGWLKGGGSDQAESFVSVADIERELAELREDLRDELQCRPNEDLIAAEARIARQDAVIASQDDEIAGLTVARDALAEQVEGARLDVAELVGRLNEAQGRLDRVRAAAAAAVAEPEEPDSQPGVARQQ